jgi:hypothetical protein
VDGEFGLRGATVNRQLFFENCPKVNVIRIDSTEGLASYAAGGPAPMPRTAAVAASRTVVT